MGRSKPEQFYHNFLDLNKNTDPEAGRLRETYDTNLREKPKGADQKYLETQNSMMRQKIAELERKNDKE